MQSKELVPYLPSMTDVLGELLDRKPSYSIIDVITVPTVGCTGCRGNGAIMRTWNTPDGIGAAGMFCGTCEVRIEAARNYLKGRRLYNAEKAISTGIIPFP